MVDRDSPIPIYYQIKAYFKGQMESGNLRSGDRLPTEMELCERYGISRAPVRQAFTELAHEGYVYRRPGQGTFVTPAVSARLHDQTEIRVLSHYDVRWLGSLEYAVRRWNHLHPDQEVTLRMEMCSRPEYHQALRRAVVQGEAPDLVPLDYIWITDYAVSGYITPLDKLDATWASALKETLEPPVMENNIVDGHLYGLPVQTDVTGLWYRRDWFDAEGLEPPASWEELLAVVDHFTRAEVQERLGYDYAIAFPVGARVGEATSNVLFTFFWSSAAELGVRGRGPLRLSPEAIEHTLRFLTQITHARRGCLPPDMDALYWWDFSRLLAQGRVPLIFGGTYEWPRIQEEFAWTEAEEVVEHLGLVPLPRPSRAVEPQVSLGGTSWAVLQQSPVAEVSLELLKIASSTEMSRTFCTEYLQISPYREVNRLFSDEDHPWLSAVVPLLALARPRPKLPNYAQVSLFLQDMIQQVLWEGAPLDETVRHTMQSLALLT